MTENSSPILLASSMALTSIYGLTREEFVGLLTIIVLILTAINQVFAIYKTKKELKKLKDSK